MLSRLILELGNAYSIIILIYCIFTWFPIPSSGVVADIKRFFATLTEPYLKLFQKLIPPIGGAVDITPIIALLVLQFVVSLLARMVAGIG